MSVNASCTAGPHATHIGCRDPPGSSSSAVPSLQTRTNRALFRLQRRAPSATSRSAMAPAARRSERARPSCRACRRTWPTSSRAALSPWARARPASQAKVALYTSWSPPFALDLRSLLRPLLRLSKSGLQSPHYGCDTLQPAALQPPVVLSAAAAADAGATLAARLQEFSGWQRLNGDIPIAQAAAEARRPA